MNRIEEYIQYHIDSSVARDIDPQVEAIQYLCNRYELNIEQRYWLCFLFATNYCVPTTFYIYNEFPDYQVVDVGRLQRWWDANRAILIFTTDRAWVRSRNQFVGVYQSYRNLIRKYSGEDNNQRMAFQVLMRKARTPYEAYDIILRDFKVEQFGRFAMFLYTELLRNVCGVDILCRFDLRQAESSRNGLAFAMGIEDIAYSGRGGNIPEARIIEQMNKGLMEIARVIYDTNILPRHKSMWSIETTLCAYKKYKLGRRYVGYYIERMRKEIVKMESATGKMAGGGVDWTPLWQFREETYNKKYLKEWGK